MNTEMKAPDMCHKCKFSHDLFNNGGLFCTGFDPDNTSWFVCGFRNLKNDCKNFKEKE